MDVSTLTCYKGNKYNLGIHGNRTFAAVRLAAVIFITMMSVSLANAGTQDADTVIVSSQASAHIDFDVNLTDFDKTYHANSSNLEKVLARIDSMVLNPDMQVRRITVVGTASPEGPYRNNVRLASERAKAFTSILKARYPFPDSIYSISSIPEDWDGMRLMLLNEDNSIPYAHVVIKFLDETRHLLPDTREDSLKRLDGGRPYSSVHRHVLPYLRCASVLVCYDTRSIKQPLTYRKPSFPAPDTILHTSVIPVGLKRFHGFGTPRRRFFAIKTNLLWDAALCANLGFELELWPHWSLDVPVWYSPYDISDRWRIRLLAVQPEVRWWPEDAGYGHFFGIHASVIGFNVSTGGDFRYQDPNHAAFGLGVGYGYSFHLDKEHRWGLEAQIGAGYISYKWIKYHNTGRNGAEVSRSAGTYWGLTRAGITLSYKFYRQRKGRRWMKW